MKRKYIFNPPKISMNKQAVIELFFSEFSKHEVLESWLDLCPKEKNRAAKFRQEKDQISYTIVRSSKTDPFEKNGHGHPTSKI
jgi:hypothetical protein